MSGKHKIRFIVEAPLGSPEEEVSAVMVDVMHFLDAVMGERLGGSVVEASFRFTQKASSAKEEA